MRRRTGVLIVFLTACASTPPAPSPTPPATVDVAPAEALPPIKIVDAPPPVIAPKPETNPVLDRLVADSPTLQQDVREIAREHPEETKAQAADKLVAIVRDLDSRDGSRDDRIIPVYDAMTELGGDTLTDFLLSEAERAEASLHRRRAAFVAAESATPGDPNRAARRKTITTELLRLAAKEKPSRDGLQEATEITKRLRPGFRRCYNRARASEPALEATFRVNVRVDARGAVADAKAEATPAKELARCVEGIVRATLFSPPQGGGSNLTIPIAFAETRTL